MNTVVVLNGEPRRVGVIDLVTPYFESVVVPNVGLGNIIAGWKFDEAAGFGSAVDVRGVAPATAGGDVTQGVATDVVARPVAAAVTSSLPGDAFDAGDPAGGELDFDVSVDPFTFFCWAKLDGTAAGGLISKLSIGGAGYQVRLRPDVNPDQMQFSVSDGVNSRIVVALDDSVSDDVWHLWCFVNDPSAGQLRIHRDKTAAVSTTNAGVGDTSNAQPFIIGDDVQFRSMCGLINHLYVCSVALSQAQVDALFDGG